MKQLKNRPSAVAHIRGGNETPEISGTVRFYQKPRGVMVVAEVYGLPNNSSGFFGMHIHEGKMCAGTDFSETEGHFNPTGEKHPLHAGDLPPLLNTGCGAHLSLFTDRFCVGDILGRTLVIHGAPDDFRTQPAGDSGKKIACGVICPR